MRMSPLVRTLAALTVGCAALTATPVIASAAPAAVHAPAKHKMKVKAAAAKARRTNPNDAQRQDPVGTPTPIAVIDFAVLIPQQYKIWLTNPF